MTYSEGLEEQIEELKTELSAAEDTIKDLEEEAEVQTQQYTDAEAELKLALQILVKAKLIEDKPIITENDLHWLLQKYS